MPWPMQIRSLFVNITLCAGAGLWLAPSSARADVAVAGDLELDAPFDLEERSAPGFALRVGWQLHLPAIVLVPEVGYHHVEFGNEVTLNRGFAGARLAIGEIFRFGAFAHVGFGNAAFHREGEDRELSDLTYDVGGFFDFTLLPLLDVGVHAGYGRVRSSDDGPGLEWVPVGVHLALIL